jgi:hypothetical protein
MEPMEIAPMQASTEITRLEFLSSFRCEADFRVVTGPMAGRRVSVRYKGVEFYRQDRMDGGGSGLSVDEYERDVVSAAGIVHSRYGEVTQDVVAAVKRHFAGSDPDQSFESLCTGRYIHGTGWVRTA